MQVFTYKCSLYTSLINKLYLGIVSKFLFPCEAKLNELISIPQEIIRKPKVFLTISGGVEVNPFMHNVVK